MTALAISNGVLWILVLVLSAVVLALVRQLIDFAQRMR